MFEVQPDSRVLTKCHWQSPPHRHSTLLLVHGLEGCTESHYMRGIAHKAWHAGLNVVRMNLRNCGGTEHLTPTLYNGGMSRDLRAVVSDLANDDRLSEIWVAGYSLGGNLALKLAGEVEDHLPALKGVVAVCPNIHPAKCVEALQKPENWIYYQYFLWNLKDRLQRKSQFFPNKWDLSQLKRVRTLREFDDAFTSKDDGYKDALDYYERSGSRHVLGNIDLPTLVITAQDDPFIPYHIFEESAIRKNPAIHFIAPLFGGHCGFLQKPQLNEDLFWAENRILDFVQDHEAFLA
jgi:predicted alpha/beta-fold hydrolase